MKLARSWLGTQRLRLDEDGLARLQRRLEIRRAARIVEATVLVAAVVVSIVAINSGALDPSALDSWALAAFLALPAVVRLCVGWWCIRAERAVRPAGVIRYARPDRLRATTALGGWYLASLAALVALAVGGAAVSLAVGLTDTAAVAGAAVALAVGYSWFVVRRGLAVSAVGASPAELAVDERLRAIAIRDDLSPVGVQLTIGTIFTTVGAVATGVSPWTDAAFLVPMLTLFAHQFAATRWPWSPPLAEAARAQRDVARLLGGDLRAMAHRVRGRR